MNANKWLMLGALAGVLALVGCDKSKAELEQTKQQLASVTADRDALKGQVQQQGTQIQQLTQQLADANGKLAAAAQANIADGGIAGVDGGMGAAAPTMAPAPGTAGHTMGSTLGGGTQKPTTP